VLACAFFFALIEAVLVNAEVTALQDIVYRKPLPSDPQKNNQTTCEVIGFRSINLLDTDDRNMYEH